jgi:hypothetical protein
MGKTNFDQIELDKEPSITTANVAQSVNADAAIASPTVAEYNTLVDLVNELKSKLNAICKG